MQLDRQQTCCTFQARRLVFVGSLPVLLEPRRVRVPLTSSDVFEDRLQEEKYPRVGDGKVCTMLLNPQSWRKPWLSCEYTRGAVFDLE